MDLVHPTTGEISESPSLTLELPDDLAFDDWCALGKKLCSGSKVINWWIGDWWASGQHRYGERAKVAALGIFGREFGSIHRTVEQVDRDHARGCRCTFPLTQGHEASCDLAGPVDYQLRKEARG